MLKRPALVLSTVLFAALPAFAHSRPKVMVPAANSTVAAPSEVSVVFTEALEPKFSSLALTDAAGKTLSTEHSKADPADPKHLTLALPTLAPGTYFVHWVSTAPDGHKMDGDYSFSVK
ncbi:hypothetical protein SAMN05421770_106286 [Granulicella rosea]|uniref:CopC domain-containing protein n=1 Tax=Granulicella rosea TaxID=474952 RepID=A0A239LDW2_9BACT|nr:copper resistance protein CopC [Granulicella rosea]SNT28033.1 hypothetical protein SAMN05421770_106286 [Granulicella rosea]